MHHKVNQTPEEIARDRIDDRLRAAGWHVQDRNAIDFSAGSGIAVREFPTDTGPADYVLFCDKRAVGVVEAKPDIWGEKITTVEEQSERYANAELKWVANTEPLPFLYESTGQITRFTNGCDPNPRSREVFSFHQPATLNAGAQVQIPLRAGIASLPPLNPAGLRECQITAITNLEDSLKIDRPRALIQMATGSGKTFTAITEIYRLLKHARAQRVLFLVDTRNLGEQAEQEFMGYLPNDDNRKFTELYNVHRLRSASIADNVQVVISTIQRMYATLKGEEFDDALEEQHPEERRWRPRKPLPVVYNAGIPPEYFDVVVIDECHRSIYNLWRQAVEYFDAYLIGLTATPDNRTYGFFRKNVVCEYTHEQAVADKVNVGNEIYLIDTLITQSGGTIKDKQLVEKRERQTRARRWEVQDETEDYGSSQLDRSIVNPDQIRTVIRAFHDNWQRIFPGRVELPKTLLFAKTDSHADDIIQTVRQEFGEGNQFCRKITNAAKSPKSSLAGFRNDYYPRIAVTVDMIATGTDVKPLECLLFMRDVKSRSYFEQMKGRGTRVLTPDDLRKVTPSAHAKTHYVIVDAVGVTKSIKTASQPLDTKPSIPFKDLATALMMGDWSEETVSSLAGRLSRLDNTLDVQNLEKIEQEAGKSLSVIVRDLLDAIDTDKIEADAIVAGNLEPDEFAMQAAREERIKRVASVFSGPLINLMDTIRRENEQIIDHDNLDTLLRAEWDGDLVTNANQIAKDFEEYLSDNRDEIDALAIFFTQPARRVKVTYTMIKDLLAKLKRDRPRLAPLTVWAAYAHLDEYKGENPINELTALVALIRRVCGLDKRLTRHSDRVRRNFQTWIMNRHAGAGEKFSEEQMTWLRMIRDHVVTSFTIERDDLEMAPFDSYGGLGRMFVLFGDSMDELMSEVSLALAA